MRNRNIVSVCVINMYNACSYSGRHLCSMPCGVCRNVRGFGQVRRSGVLQVTRDETLGGFFHFSATKSGAGMKRSRCFLIPSFASVWGIAIDVLRRRSPCLRLNYLMSCNADMRFNDRTESINNGAPLGISVNRIEDRLMQLFTLYVVSVWISSLTYTSSNVVQKIQKNENLHEQFNVKDLRL